MFFDDELFIFHDFFFKGLFKLHVTKKGFHKFLRIPRVKCCNQITAETETLRLWVNMYPIIKSTFQIHFSVKKSRRFFHNTLKIKEGITFY